MDWFMLLGSVFIVKDFCFIAALMFSLYFIDSDDVAIVFFSTES